MSKRAERWRRLDNLVAAVPEAPEPFLNTMEIWHRCPYPKPSFHAAKKHLQEWATSGCGLVRIGCKQGPQFYRYDEDAW